MHAARTQSRRPLLSVVVPVFNEEMNLAPLIREIGQALENGPAYEIVYVDDGSEDRTAEVLRALESECADLHVVRHHARRGQSTALLTGARAARGEWIASLDGDGQNVPGDLPRLLQCVISAHEQDPDVVCIAGIRTRRQDSWLRLMSSRIANTVRNAMLHDGIPDTGCGLKVFQREAFLALPLFDHFHRFIPALFQASGGQVLQLPVSHRPRMAGQSKYGLWDRLWVGIADLVGVLWLRHRILDQPWKEA